MSTQPTVANQFHRIYSLVLAGQNGEAIDLSELHFTFQVYANDTETPNTAFIRVFNTSDSTSMQALKEYDTVILQTGYQNGNLGTIFSGVVKQYKRGRSQNVDSYLDIAASDGDPNYNFGVVNTTFPSGTSPSQQLNTYANALGLPVDPNAASFLTGGVILNPRGKPAFGLARVYMRDLVETHNCRWSIQKGVLTVIPITGYLPGDVVQINSSTGMISVPEATDDGIHITTLLNSSIQIGQRVQINNRDITQTTIKNQFFPSYSSGPNLVARVTEDGFYRVLVIEHEGDTRGDAWYTHLTCLSLDPSATPSASISPFGDAS